MALQWIDRVSRLVRADAHGILDSLEDRALLLKQHLREAEIELQHKRALREALADEERSLDDDAKTLEEAVAALDADMHLALAREREDLARFAIRQIIPKRREVTTLRARIQEIAEERERLGGVIERQEAEFEELRARVRAHLSEEAHRAEAAAPAWAGAVADEEIELELLRHKQASGVHG